MNKDILDRINKFVSDRDWEQFHSPENLAKSIIIESAELLEHFQWDNNFDHEEIKEELADVIIYAYMFANKMQFNIDEIVINKLEKNEKKYPVEKSKGNSKKYTEL